MQPICAHRSFRVRFCPSGIFGGVSFRSITGDLATALASFRCEAQTNRPLPPEINYIIHGQTLVLDTPRQGRRQGYDRPRGTPSHYVAILRSPRLGRRPQRCDRGREPCDLLFRSFAASSICCGFAVMIIGCSNLLTNWRASSGLRETRVPEGFALRFGSAARSVHSIGTGASGLVCPRRCVRPCGAGHRFGYIGLRFLRARFRLSWSRNAASFPRRRYRWRVPGGARGGRGISRPCLSAS